MRCEAFESRSEGATSIELIDCLYRYAMILVENRAVAEDLVHETYVLAIPTIGLLREEDNIKGCLFRTFRNVWLHQFEKGQTHFQSIQTDVEYRSGSDMIDHCKGARNSSSSKQEEEQVWSAIQRLPRDFREIIFLREFERFSYYEIASLLDFPVETVMARLAGARSMLRILLPLLLKRDERNECLKRYN